MIQVQGLTKRYGQHLAVDRLSFTVEKGQVYGFLGPNGAGKSTTMNIMTGYIGPTQGEVLIDGISITAEPEKAKKLIGYLPEHPPLYFDMTVMEYLLFTAGLKQIPKKERKEQANNVMEMTKLNDVSSRLIKNLSKGFRQRVGLSQALLGFPEIIILDEPTVGLDPKQIIEIRTLIKDLSKKHTVILSSHILSEVQEVCDHILIIHKGQMVAGGTQAALQKQFSGNSSMEITLKTDPSTAKNFINPIVSDCEINVIENSGESILTIDSIGQRDIRERVFRACAEENIPLLGMKMNIYTLEDIFLDLTNDISLNNDEPSDTDKPESEEIKNSADKKTQDEDIEAESVQEGGDE